MHKNIIAILLLTLFSFDSVGAFSFSEINNEILKEDSSRINLIEGENYTYDFKVINRLSGGESGITDSSNIDSKIDYSNHINYEEIKTGETITGDKIFVGETSTGVVAGEIISGDNIVYDYNSKINKLTQNKESGIFYSFFNNIGLFSYNLYLNDLGYENYDYNYLGGTSLTTFSRDLIDQQNEAEDEQKNNDLIDAVEESSIPCSGENEFSYGKVCKIKPVMARFYNEDKSPVAKNEYWYCIDGYVENKARQTCEIKGSTSVQLNNTASVAQARASCNAKSSIHFYYNKGGLCLTLPAHANFWNQDKSSTNGQDYWYCKNGYEENGSICTLSIVNDWEGSLDTSNYEDYFSKQLPSGGQSYLNPEDNIPYFKFKPIVKESKNSINLDELITGTEESTEAINCYNKGSQFYWNEGSSSCLTKPVNSNFYNVNGRTAMLGSYWYCREGYITEGHNCVSCKDYYGGVYKATGAYSGYCAFE